MRIATVLLLAVFTAGCASVSVDERRDGEGRLTRKVSVRHSYTTVTGASMLLDSTRHLSGSERGADVAEKAIAAGMPVSINTGGVRVSAGYGYAAYGQLSATQAATWGAIPGGLPVLPAPVVATPIHPSSSEAGGHHGSLPVLPELDAPVPCPSDREAVTAAERIACNEKDIDAVISATTR